MFPGAPQIIQNALQSEEPESAKKFIQGLEIAWASQSVEVDLSKLSKDNLGTSYIPDNICSKPEAGTPLLQVSRNGNCLYNSATLVLCGEKQCSHYLRILIAEELHFNAQFYAIHEIFKITEKHSGIPDSMCDRIHTASGSQADAVNWKQ